MRLTGRHDPVINAGSGGVGRRCLVDTGCAETSILGDNHVALRMAHKNLSRTQAVDIKWRFRPNTCRSTSQVLWLFCDKTCIGHRHCVPGQWRVLFLRQETTENDVHNRAKQSPTYKIVAGERLSIRTNRRLKPDHWLALGIPRKAGGQSGHPAFRAGKSWLTRDGIRSLDVALGSHLKP